MNDNTLRSFLAAADCGSFNKAAAGLFISKQALIKQIDALEKELDFELFNRTKTGITLTPAGEEYARLAGSILRKYDEGLQNCRDISRNVQTLRISCPPHPRLLLESVIEKFSTKYPDIHQEIVLRNPGYQIMWSKLTDDLIDVAECAHRDGIEDREHIGYMPLAKMYYHCLVYPGHPLADRKQISVSELSDQRIGVGSITRNPDIVSEIKNSCSNYQLIERSGDEVAFILNHCLNRGVYVSHSFYTTTLPPLISIPIIPEIYTENDLYFRLPVKPKVEAFLKTAAEIFKVDYVIR